MKISKKLFIFLMLIIAAFVAVTAVTISSTLREKVEADRLEMSANITNQMLDCYINSASNIAVTVNELSRGEYLANELGGQSRYAAQLNLRLKLDTIKFNCPFVLDCFVYDTDGKLFFSSDITDVAVYRQVYEDGVFASDTDNYWTVDGDGQLYFRCNLYRMYPYSVVGAVVYVIDRDQLRSMVGFENLPDGSSCVFNKYGTIMLLGSQPDNCGDKFASVIEELRQNGSIPEKMSFDGVEYYVITVGSSSGYNAACMIEDSLLLKTYFDMVDFIRYLAVILIVIALAVSRLFAGAFTHRLDRLGKSIREWKGEEEEDLSFRVNVTGRDEIGLLAGEFNRLLSRIEDLHRRILEESRASEAVKYDLLDFKYRSLQAQISPHFLCNIMNSISMLAAGGSVERVQKLATLSGQYLRDNLGSNDRRFNTVNEEIKLVTEYVQLANTISAVPLRFTVDCDDEAGGIPVPNMILQPLVENSIKHGIPPRFEGTFNIHIGITLTDDDRVRISVKDNGVGYSRSVIDELKKMTENDSYHSKEVGFGTAGVLRRLQLQYENDMKFEIENQIGGGASTVIELPTE